jgi:hypothetical protein
MMTDWGALFQGTVEEVAGYARESMSTDGPGSTDARMHARGVLRGILGLLTHWKLTLCRTVVLWDGVVPHLNRQCHYTAGSGEGRGK